MSFENTLFLHLIDFASLMYTLYILYCRSDLDLYSV